MSITVGVLSFAVFAGISKTKAQQEALVADVSNSQSMFADLNGPSAVAEHTLLLEKMTKGCPGGKCKCESNACSCEACCPDGQSPTCVCDGLKCCCSCGGCDADQAIGRDAVSKRETRLFMTLGQVAWAQEFSSLLKSLNSPTGERAARACDHWISATQKGNTPEHLKAAKVVYHQGSMLTTEEKTIVNAFLIATNAGFTF